MSAVEVPFGVGDEIRRARLDAGMKQEELARLVGVSRPTLSNWERGQGEPSLTQSRLIAHVTGAAWFLRQNLKYVTYGRRTTDLDVVPDLPGQTQLCFTSPPALVSVGTDG